MLILPARFALLVAGLLTLGCTQAQSNPNSLSVRYEAAPPELRAIAAQAKKDAILEGWREQIEALLPDQGLQLLLTMRTCDEANAFYDSDEQSIIYCYEELQDTQNNFAHFEAEGQLNAEEAQAFAVGWSDYLFFHELGHALIDQLEIPMLGREEDVADQISTYIWVHREDGEHILNGTIFSFGAWDDDVSEDGLAATHSLNGQRYYNVMCWTYGADTERYSDAGDQLPEGRRDSCEEEYWQLANAIEQLVPLHFDEDPAP